MDNRLLGVTKEEKTGSVSFLFFSAVCTTVVSVTGFLSCSQAAAQKVDLLVSSRSVQGTNDDKKWTEGTLSLASKWCPMNPS
jgi:hypothetical protein